MLDKKGQVWIETVIYILIGLALIALVLSFVLPRINEQKDRIMIEQTILSLNQIDEAINEVIDAGEGNRRIIELNMKVGKLSFDFDAVTGNSDTDKIIFLLNGLEKPYSEPGLEIPIGRVKAKTSNDKIISVTLTLEYKGVADLTFNDKQIVNEVTPSSRPYRFAIENKGATINIIKIS